MSTPVQRRFDAAAAQWDQEARRVKLAHDVAEAVRLAVPLRPEMDVLDYGCGTGLVGLELRPQVRSLTAADASAGMVEVLRTKVAERGLTNVHALTVGEAGEELQGRRFDLVVSSMTMHHVAAPGTLLARLRDLLLPGGALAVADLDPDGGAFHDDPAGVSHHGFDRAEFAALAAHAGFVDVRTTTAATVVRERDGARREFTVFLVTGRRPATAEPEGLELR